MARLVLSNVITTMAIISLFISISTSCNNTKMNNPLLTETGNLYNAPAFDKITIENYKPAFEAAIATAKERIEAIVNNRAEPDFENTIEALEFAGRELSSVGMIFFNMIEANTNDDMHQIALEVSPLLTDYSNDILLNVHLFEKIKAVYQKREQLGLNAEQLRLLNENYKSFIRNGANLNDADKEALREIRKELSEISLRFGQNVLSATNEFTLHITDKAQLEGLPQFVIDMGSAEAKERSMEGWVYTLQAPSMGPFMKYSSIRELREKVWRAYGSRSLGGEFDNRVLAIRSAELRLKLANLLGHPTYASYSLEDNMAKTQERVNDFLNDLLQKTYPYAKAEVAEIERYANNNGFRGKLMPWDFSYWSEKYRDEKYAINDELLKPYFELGKVEKAVLGLATKLYGLQFAEESSIPVYHPDVKVYSVKDESGRHLSLLYLDYFPRASKSGGAWMTTFRDQHIFDKKEMRPFVSLVCNFTKPTEDTPSLLTFDEVNTLLHEFGHALHGMLAQGSYPSLTGTNVALDFVELPSQIMENWLTESEYLKSFAQHYQTGEAIPDELIKKIVDARNFLSGYGNVRQLSFGLNDMAWHTLTSIPQNIDVEIFEKEAIKSTQVLPSVDATCFSVAFNHIFSGGYSAGYYSYKWAEVLEADAFSLFKERGIFNREVAQSFRENILSKGNLTDADELFRNFRGRDPQAEALLEKFGMK